MNPETEAWWARNALYMRPLLPPREVQEENVRRIEEARAAQLSLQAAGLDERTAHRTLIGLPVTRVG